MVGFHGSENNSLIEHTLHLDQLTFDRIYFLSNSKGICWTSDDRVKFEKLKKIRITLTCVSLYVHLTSILVVLANYIKIEDVNYIPDAGTVFHLLSDLPTQ